MGINHLNAKQDIDWDGSRDVPRDHRTQIRPCVEWRRERLRMHNPLLNLAFAWTTTHLFAIVLWITVSRNLTKDFCPGICCSIQEKHAASPTDKCSWCHTLCSGREERSNVFSRVGDSHSERTIRALTVQFFSCVLLVSHSLPRVN